MDWPTLAINVVTYNRKETLRVTLQRLQTHLYYVGPRALFVADDGSDDGTQAMLAEEFPGAVLVQSSRVGMGANRNYQCSVPGAPFGTPIRFGVPHPP